MDQSAGEPVRVEAPVLRAWMAGAVERLTEHRGGLDGLNVFPVPDSDTGTNLCLTLADASAAIGRLPADASTADVVLALRRGALVGARGNSGVIVGQYVGVLAAALADAAPGALTTARLVAALGTAADAARRAVAEPVHGTVLTVADEIHRATTGVGTTRTIGSEDVLGLLGHGLDGGYVALAATTAQLPVLTRAGVCDAGAWGLLLVVEALLAALGGRPRARDLPLGAGTDALTRPHGPCDVADDRCCAGVTGFEDGGEFEVMYLVSQDSTEDGAQVAPRLRTALADVGDSVAVVGADGLWQAHVHTDVPLAALQVPAVLGLRGSHAGIRHLASLSAPQGHRRPPLGLVVVTSAPGLVADLARTGAVVLLAVDGAPDAGALDRAVDDTGAAEVLVVSVHALGPVTHHGGAGAVTLTVLDALSEVQVVAAAATLAVGSPETSVPALLRELEAAVKVVRCAEVGDVGGRGHPGRVDQDEVRRAAVQVLGADRTLLTVVTGGRTDPAVVTGFVDGLAGTHPEVEVVVLAGASGGDGLWLGAE